MTRLRGSGLNGRPLPRVRVVPRSGGGDGDLACELAAGYGLVPDEHQEDVLEAWLGRRANGRWASAVCGFAEPRQNGKNACVEIRELYGMVELGERFLHTAHEVKTGRKSFRRIKSFFDNPRKYPELASMVKELRQVNGQEAIFLTNGGSVEFIARSRSSGRGFDGIDVLVCDEAQELTDEEQAALLPTISAATLGNPQVIFIGTPPDPAKGQTGEVFVRIRRDALARRDSRLCWIEFGVPDGELPNIDDRRVWFLANAALGSGRLQLAEVERELSLMSPESFARERLGWWGDPQAGADVFGAGKWISCVGPRPRGLKPGALSVAVSYELTHGAIGSAAFDDGVAYLKPLQHGPGTDWLVNRAKVEQVKHGVDVVVDGKGPGAVLIPDLEQAGVRLKIAATADVLDACADLFNSVRDGKVRHESYAELDAAVAAAVKRPVGDRWAWGRRVSTADISTLEAVTLAAWWAERSATYNVLASVL